MIPDLPSILRYARLSALAYDGVKADFTAMGLRVAQSIHDAETDTQVIVLCGQERIYVVFPGTASVRDCLTDVQVRRVGTDWIWQDQKGITVHRGFWKATTAVRNQVRHTVQALRGEGREHVTFLGHSLGGALAMLVAIDLEEAWEPVNEVVTFGQPRCGNAAFRDFYNSRLGERTIRVVNQIDAIPRLPGVLMGYRHAGQELFIDGFNAWEMNPPLPVRLVTDAWSIFKDWRLKRVSTAGNHFVRDYVQQLEVLNAG